MKGGIKDMSGHSNFKIISDMKPMDPSRKSALEEGLKLLIKSNFSHPEKWFVYSNLKKYKPSESIDIWGQKLGELPEICEVYCNSEWVCDVAMSDTPAVALLRIKKGLADILIHRAEDEIRIKDAKLKKGVL